MWQFLIGAILGGCAGVMMVAMVVAADEQEEAADEWREVDADE